MKPWGFCTTPGLVTVALKPRSEVQAWPWSCDPGQGCQQAPRALLALMGETGVVQQDSGPTGRFWGWRAPRVANAFGPLQCLWPNKKSDL